MLNINVVLEFQCFLVLDTLVIYMGIKTCSKHLTKNDLQQGQETNVDDCGERNFSEIIYIHDMMFTF